MDIITSANNKIVKMVRALGGVKGRDASSAFLVEGAKFVAELPKNWQIKHIILSESFAKGGGFTPDAIVVTDQIFAGLSDVVNPQGILAVVDQRTFDIEDVLGLGGDNPLIFLLEGINDPGNLGTILRNCHGLGATGVILVEHCADVYSPKVVRASAGSIFHVPFVQMALGQALTELKARNIPLYATSPAGSADLHQLDLRKPAAFALGNEHHGLSQGAMEGADETVRIPVMSESLNVSVACAIFAYETQRQRTV
ncbi:MAG: RNA methyltransferase [Defluviitaleaceae bacterium]|nr:RNA methyltransferase [Defluviitaleaceae bacterium]